jgi:GxxExxY protein
MIRHYLPSESFNIRGAIFEVYKQLGPGFLESVYHEALVIELERRHIPCESKSPIEIKYKNVTLTKHFIADFICYSKVILEIKAVKEIDDIHRAQILNYLKATGLHLGLLVNFYSYPRVHIERYIRGIPEYPDLTNESDTEH